MTVLTTKTDAVSTSSASYTLSQFFSVSGATGNPAYLVVSALDRNEYTAAATGKTGDFSAGGHTLALTATEGDARGAGIVYTWQASTDSYVNSTYGSLSALDYASSGSANDVTNISVYGCSSLSQATQLASDPYALINNDASGYLGSATIITDPKFSGTVPAQATPDSIAATAAKFVGAAWNMDGCWLLASTIAAESGAGLPVSSTLVGVAGAANGEWYVAYDGPVSSNANWQNLLVPGDVVAFENAGGQGGHITTVVSGTGGSAQLIDNITYEGPGGTIENAAHDGSANDILVASAHPGAQEFDDLPAQNVVVYALDTPLVSLAAASANSSGISLAAGGTLALSGVVSAADPEHKAITEYQVYCASSTDTILVSGKAVAAHSASTAATATTLGAVTFDESSSGGTDTIYVRAFNGAYWGDWQAVGVTGVAAKPAPPVVAQQTPALKFIANAAINYTLPSGTFHDPQGQALTLSATLASTASGSTALPSWLHFNAATGVFSGTAPSSATTLVLKITATDTSHLSASENVTLTIGAGAGSLGFAPPVHVAPGPVGPVPHGHVAGAMVVADGFVPRAWTGDLLAHGFAHHPV